MRWNQIEQETIEKVQKFLQHDEAELERKTREVTQMIVSATWFSWKMKRDAKRMKENLKIFLFFRRNRKIL